MSLLRIRCPLPDPPPRCQWAMVDGGAAPVTGESTLAQLPPHLLRRAERTQLVIPASQVLITRALLPQTRARRSGSLLAYAVEDLTAGDPDANHVSRLGAVAGSDVLAVVDKSALARWREAFDAAGIRHYEVHCETLLLPWAADAWSLAWDGREGFVRTGKFEGAATDRGDGQTPPLALRLLLEEAAARGASPASIAIYATLPGAAPDIEAWTRELGIAVRSAGSWDWRSSPPSTGVSLVQEHQRWRAVAGSAARLRPAAWILGAALAVQAAALAIDWSLLAHEQRALRQQLESRFRAVFPDVVAVVDPALQMRRKLAQARHDAGLADGGDLLPMIEQVALAAKELPAGAVRALSYEGGRITLELSGVDAAGVRRIAARLLQAGLSVDTSPASTRAAGATVVLTVRAT